MKQNFINKLLLIVLCVIVLLAFAACENSNVSEKLKPTPLLGLSLVKYDDFDGGLTAFSNDYYKIKTFLFDMADYTGINSTFKSNGEKEHYDGLVQLFSMLDLELITFVEYDSILPKDEFSDRVDGLLISTGRYGYKIKQSSKLKFGCDETTSNSKYTMTGEISSSSNFMKSDAMETIMNKVKYTTKTEIIIEDSNKFVLRYAKSAENTENDKVFTRAAYVIYENGKANVAYYEGERSLDNIIAFDKLIDYNMNAITFGLGTVLNFEVNMQ